MSMSIERCWRGTAMLAGIAAMIVACGDMYEAAEVDLGDPSDGGGDAATDGDADSDSDSDSDSDAETDTDDETDTGIADYDTDPELYAEAIDGFVLVMAARFETSGLNYTASAQFYDVTLAEEFHEEVVDIDYFTGTEDCGLQLDEGWGWGMDGEIEWLTAGEVSVASGTQSAILAQQDGGLVIRYEADLTAWDYEPRYGEPYSFVTTGDESAAIDLDPAFTLPEDLQIIAPDLAVDPALPADDVTLLWTNTTDGGTVWIQIMAEEELNCGTPPYYWLTCEAIDDGEFVLPGTLLEQIPSGWVAHLSISRSAIAFHNLGDGRTILGRGIVHQSWILSME